MTANKAELEACRKDKETFDESIDSAISAGEDSGDDTFRK